MRKGRDIILFILIFINHIAYSQSENYRFGKLDISNGLSNNQIVSIYKDSKGFMWFGTMSGLNRYNGYSFKIFTHSVRDSLSIPDNYIYGIYEDHKANIWAATRLGLVIYNTLSETFERNSEKYLKLIGVPLQRIHFIFRDQAGLVWYVNRKDGIARYNRVNNEFELIKNIPNDTTSISTDEISALVDDKDGNIWIIYRTGLLEKLDCKTNKVVSRDNYLKFSRGNSIADYNIFVDSDNDVWLASANLGVYYYRPANKTFKILSSGGHAGTGLNTNIVRAVSQDNKGHVWIATDHGGVNIIDKHNFNIEYVLSDPDDKFSISQNSITCLYKDEEGIIWLGTFKKGINFYHENLIRFKNLKRPAKQFNTLQLNDINCIAEDKFQNLWMGTNGGGLIYYNRATGKYTNYQNNPGDAQSLSNNVVVSMCVDHQNSLWAGTYYGGLNCFKNNAFVHYRNDPGNPSSINNDNIWEIYQDKQNRLWIGTLGGGLEFYNYTSNNFKHFNTKVSSSISNDFISSLAEDRNGELWVGTAWGINVLDPKAKATSYHLLTNTPNYGLSNSNVISLLEDSRGNMWVGTREGLNCINRKAQTNKVFRIEDGLPDNTINSLLEDNNGNIWVGTPKGLTNLIITKKPEKDSLIYIFKTYNESDGLQGVEFNENAAIKTRKGEIIFGGTNGFNIFNPQEIKINMNLPVVVFTDLFIYNKSIKANEIINGRVLLNRSFGATNEIVLKHKENFFIIEFAALSYFQPEKNMFSYKLEGFSKEWITVDSKVRKATFTNLNAGEYIFKVKASNNDGFWNETPTTLKIVILPPFYKTKIAMVLYVLFIITVLFIARKMLLERARMKFKLEHERLEAQRMHELDMLKIRFFTNVSHEFRTPLTLIVAPIERLIKNTLDTELNKQYVMIQRNAKRLLNLVNQLLDFRKMEVHEVALNPTQADIIPFINDIVNSFSDISEKKDIQLIFETKIEALTFSFDQDKLEKILFNLLSNAFKFTPAKGSVKVEVLMDGGDSAVNNPEIKPGNVLLKVTDTGIGISADKLGKIFERFFQSDVPGNMMNQGSGIGLSITREFVKLHGGTITVDSKPGGGSCFSVYLPVKNHDLVRQSEFLTAQNFNFGENESTDNSSFETDTVSNKAKKPVLLLVEDNIDFRFYLKDNLRQTYQIIEAGNGNEGLKHALAHIPDLIVSDIMMPVMDGIELCKQVKNDRRLSHIPIILLTAKASDDQVVTGFQIGADDYITKPFNFEILLSRIKNLLKKRDAMRKSFTKHLEINPSEITVTSLDEQLINKALALVEKNIANADFSVEDMSKELGMSRVHLYKKLLSITGKSPIEFIRTIRLKTAAQLLKKSQLTVSEIAYKVGFNNPKYFSKYFKAEFNMLPTQYIHEGGETNSNSLHNK